MRTRKINEINHLMIYKNKELIKVFTFRIYQDLVDDINSPDYYSHYIDSLESIFEKYQGPDTTFSQKITFPTYERSIVYKIVKTFDELGLGDYMYRHTHSTEEDYYLLEQWGVFDK